MNRLLFPRLVMLSFPLFLHVAPLAAHPPSGIVVDNAGRVFFQDSAKGVWRVEASRKPTLVSPMAWHWMTIDRGGKFANSPEQFGEWFARVTPQGEKPALIACSDFPCVMGKDGNLYFAYMHSLKIMRRTAAGAESHLVLPEQFGANASRQYGVTGITCGPDGTLYLVSLADDEKTHAVYAVGMDGSIRTYAKNFVTGRIPESQRHPQVGPEYCRGMAVDRQGHVYIAVTGNRCVMKLAPDGGTRVVLRSERPWTPTGVAEHKGEIFVLEYDDETPTEGRNWPPRIRKVAKDGQVTVIVEIKR